MIAKYWAQVLCRKHLISYFILWILYHLKFYLLHF